MINTEQLVQDVMDGKQNPYEALYLLKKLLTDTKVAIEIVEVEAFNQCEYEDKNFINGNFKIEKRNGGKIWNFKNVDEWNTYDKAKKECEDRLKAAYLANEKGLQMADEDGEIVPLPIVTFKKDSLIIKKI